MYQIIQSLKSGDTILAEVPTPLPTRGSVLIRSRYSLVSLGTERMLVEFGKANLLQKSRQQPEKVKQVLSKIKTDGLLPTLDAVLKKLDEPVALGYCNAGEVVAVGEDVKEFRVGDRVASNGPHAEFVLVPKNLVARIPDDVSFEEATFTVISSISLQGIRLINPTFGETITVIGLGLIGLITCQLLKANGCKVIGYDFDENKVKLASTFGVTAFVASDDSNPIHVCLKHSNGIGVDGVIITASTASNEVISQAAQMSRKKGRIVLVGVVGLDIKRSDFYEKELSFQVSCSYGPGRYDENYEQKGLDYPLPYVRWTEKRNFEAVLNAISEGTLKVKPLISQIVELKEFELIYGKMSSNRSIASLIKFTSEQQGQPNRIKLTDHEFSKGKATFGIIGAGNFTKMMIAPAMRKLKFNLKYIASEKGLSAAMLAKKYGIKYATSDYREILKDPEVSAVAITVRHNKHAELVLEALKFGKHVFVEKPLALTFDEIDEIEDAYQNTTKTLTVGFNRRFSPFSRKAKTLLAGSGPINVIATINAGFIPADSWVHDMSIGGGRIIGEACHFIDLITFFTGSLVRAVTATANGTNPKENTDNVSILLRYINGSIGVINYYSNGNKAFPKERIEIYSEGRNLVIDNFRKLSCYGFSTSGFSKSQDKGHLDQFRLLQDRLSEGGEPIIPLAEIFNTSKTAIAAIESLKSGGWEKIND